jgi:hypothetical protein
LYGDAVKKVREGVGAIAFPVAAGAITGTLQRVSALFTTVIIVTETL